MTFPTSPRALLAVGLLLVPLTAAPACNAILPEEYAVNAPIGSLFGWAASTPSPDEIDTRLETPSGLHVSLYADELPNARILHFTPAGDLLVSLPRSGSVVLLERGAFASGNPVSRRTLLEGLNRPYGLEVHDGWLYVAETDAVGRARFDSKSGTLQGPFERIVEGLPGGGNHWSRTLRFGPDGKLYVSVGSSCNVCIEEDPRRAALLRFNADGSGAEIFATGLRNSVGFDWQPGTGKLYATDNGRDLLGDDFPPDELNEIREGGFYGWPFANGNRVPDPSLGKNRKAEIAQSIPPAHAFRAHNAPLGMTFVRSPKAPAELRGAAVVALHGSWNRTRKDGYKVVSLHWNDRGEIEERDFLAGFLENENVIGRPADVAEGPDGAIYVSDDYAGVIWRVAPDAPGPEGRTATPKRPAGAHSAAANFAPGDRVRGRRLFGEKGCAGCHDAAHATPGVVPAPLRNLPSRYDAPALEALLETPPPPMPVVPLSREERRDLVAYLLAPGTDPGDD